MSGVQLGGRESDLTIPECGLAIDHIHDRPYAYPYLPTYSNPCIPTSRTGPIELD